MEIKKAYEIYHAVEKIAEKDEAIGMLCRAIANREYLEKGELKFVGNNSNNEGIMWRIPIEKENIELFLNLLLESMTDKKKEIIKQIEEL